MGKLDGKVAVVTGASMGIGEAIAKLFVEEGASVMLSSRDAGRAEAARARIGRPERTMAVACDVRNREEIDRLLSLTLHNFGRVDIWVNNAGHGHIDAVENMDMRECRAMFDTNLFGALDGMQVAIAAMRRQGGGTIINISSVAGWIPMAGSAGYSATKAAMNYFGRAARTELLGSGINVMTVCPGYIATDFGVNAVKGAQARRVGVAARRGAPVEVVARATLNGYLKGKREVVTPWFYVIPMWFYRFFPGLVEGYMAKHLRPAGEVIAEAQAARHSER